MARKILLDTNSYLRLAYTIHPLLFKEFGSDSCCLYVLKELDDELKASHRLQTKFAWASQEEYVANRRHQLTTSRKQKVEIENAISPRAPRPMAAGARDLFTPWL